MIGYYNVLGKDRYISADIARKGSDSTVIGVWEGLTCFKIVQLKKSLIDETTNVILKLMNDYKVDKNHVVVDTDGVGAGVRDRKSTRLNSSHVSISYAVFCLKKK